MIGKETPDRATVISGLEHCTGTAWSGLSHCQPPVGPDCPYEDSADCRQALMMDAMELLKQSAKEFENIIIRELFIPEETEEVTQNDEASTDNH